MNRGVLVVSVLVVRALVFGVKIRAPHFWKLPYPNYIRKYGIWTINPIKGHLVLKADCLLLFFLLAPYKSDGVFFLWSFLFAGKPWVICTSHGKYALGRSKSLDPFVNSST